MKERDEPVADELDGHRRIGELLCEAAITGRDADKLSSVVRALDLASGDMRADLEILARALQNEAMHPGENPVQANVRVDRRCRESGFDAQGYIRREKRRRARAAGRQAPMDELRPLVDRAAADAGVMIEDLHDASDLISGAAIGRLTGEPDARAELWRRLVGAIASTGRWPIIVADVDIGRGDGNEISEQAVGVEGPVLLRERAAMRKGDVHRDGRDEANPPPPVATGLCYGGYGARDLMLLLVPATSGPAALAKLAWDDGGTFAPSEHVAIARHLAGAHGAELAAITFSTIEFLVDRPPEDEELDRAVADRLAYGDTTFGVEEMRDHVTVRAATERDLVWGFWFD